MPLLPSSAGLGFNVLLRLKHTKVNTTAITSTMRTTNVGSTVASTVGSTVVKGPLVKGPGRNDNHDNLRLFLLSVIDLLYRSQSRPCHCQSEEL